MNRTIVLFTTAQKLRDVDANINVRTVPTLIGLGKLVGGLATGDRLVVLHDSVADDRTKFATESLTGALHVVHHELPGEADRASFMAALRSTNPALLMGMGARCRHAAGTTEAEPYAILARILMREVPDGNQADFDALWQDLEVRDPIEDLLADKLDFLHEVMATGKKPATFGKALDKAVTAADKGKAIADLITKLNNKPYETGQYTTFTALRDLVLDLPEHLPNALNP